MRTQGAWWLAMALCKQGATTVVSKHENLNRMLDHLAPPGTERGLWTAAIAWVFEPGGVFAGWTRRARGRRGAQRLGDGPIHDRAARDHELTLITRDGLLIKKKGPKQGVMPIKPEAFAASIISRDDAQKIFLDRLERAVLLWIHNPPVGNELNDFKVRANAGRILLEQYRWIWEPAGSTESCWRRPRGSVLRGRARTCSTDYRTAWSDVLLRVDWA